MATKPLDFADFAKISTSGDSVKLGQQEQHVLDLYDRLTELRLERALLEAQAHLGPAPTESELTGDELQKELKKAEHEVLEARAAYTLRQNIVANVLMVDPTLKAIHSGEDGAPRERDLRPLIKQRDVLAIAQTNVSARLEGASRSLIDVQVETIRANERNRESAETLLALTAQLKACGPARVADEAVRERVAEAAEELDEARRRRRLIRHVVAAMVAGSGLDWAADERLREMVLGDEE